MAKSYFFCGNTYAKPRAQNLNSVTPPDPPIYKYTNYIVIKNFLRFITVLLLSIFFSFRSFCQDTLSIDRSLLVIDTIPIVDTLFVTLGNYYMSEASYEIEQFTYVEKWKWLKYAPSFAWNFTLGTPIVGWNSTQLFEAINSKRKHTAYLNSIIHRINLEYQKASISLKLKYDIYGIKRAVYSRKLAIVKLEQTYISILLEEYNDHEITPTTYIQSQISYENRLLELAKLKFELNQLKNEILELAFYGIYIDLIKNIEDVSTN